VTGKNFKEGFDLDYNYRAGALPRNKDIFQSPRASAKHAYHQVNGETEMNMHNRVTQIQKRKNGAW
jgi:hypothetical protein